MTIRYSLAFGVIDQHAMADSVITTIKSGTFPVGGYLDGVPPPADAITKVSTGVYDFKFKNGSVLRTNFRQVVEIVNGLPITPTTFTTTSTGSNSVELALTPTSLYFKSVTGGSVTAEVFVMEEPAGVGQDGVLLTKLFQGAFSNGGEVQIPVLGYRNDGTSAISVTPCLRVRWETLWQTAVGTFDAATQTVLKHVSPVYFVRTDGSVHYGDSEIVIWPAVLTFDDKIVAGLVQYSYAGNYAGRTVLVKDTPWV